MVQSKDAVDTHELLWYFDTVADVTNNILTGIKFIFLRRNYHMNKAELIAAVAEKTGFTKKDAEGAVNATVGVIEEALVKGEKVQLIGFGTFEVRQRKARTGRNPKKPGETIQIAASKAPVFKAGKALKDSVNK